MLWATYAVMLSVQSTTGRVWNGISTDILIAAIYFVGIPLSFLLPVAIVRWFKRH